MVNVREIKRDWRILSEKLVDMGIQELVEAGWLTRALALVNPRGGRPREDFVVDPRVRVLAENNSTRFS